jgi:uncharacterized protein (DUF1697 family)
MTYVALLRGINVGGNNKIDMQTLRSGLESTGLKNVKTYINSGNIVVSSTLGRDDVLNMVNNQISQLFNLAVPVLVLTATEVTAIADTIPIDWHNDETHKCDVLYVWPRLDPFQLKNDLEIKSDYEEIIAVKGALIWRSNREHVTKSSLIKLPQKDVYQYLTIRNCNTARKLKSLVDEK